MRTMVDGWLPGRGLGPAWQNSLCWGLTCHCLKGLIQCHKYFLSSTVCEGSHCFHVGYIILSIILLTRIINLLQAVFAILPPTTHRGSSAKASKNLHKVFSDTATVCTFYLQYSIYNSLRFYGKLWLLKEQMIHITNVALVPQCK